MTDKEIYACLAGLGIVAITIIYIVSTTTKYYQEMYKSYAVAGLVQCPYSRSATFRTDNYYWTKPDSCPIK